MKITKTKILALTIGVLIFLIGMIALGFHAMEIEDHYGDLQDFYFKSRNGDLIIFRRPVR